MRRRLGRIIPVFAVALLVQLLSPIGAFRFVASAIADPANSIHLCSAMSSGEPGETQPADRSHDGACCAICSVGLGGGPTAAPASQDFAVIERPHQRVIWSRTEPAPPASRAHVNAQARAPPQRIVV
ncbi:DUF2946 family protein [Rhodopseudomonas palustris]|uniref:DUF2946 family protein n=1 Tax=Rhodopseudomonas palustris TaxID=1076 RepID=UPI002ACEFC15|nr:DUF2946 family protein [Rhodopseudomonas palustris]WQH00983.1 DUF2946 family protein [Rhodopseudomonas palustris]